MPKEVKYFSNLDPKLNNSIDYIDYMAQSYVPCGFLVRSPGVPGGEIHTGSERPNEDM